MLKTLHCFIIIMIQLINYCNSQVSKCQNLNEITNTLKVHFHIIQLIFFDFDMYHNDQKLIYVDAVEWFSD